MGNNRQDTMTAPMVILLRFAAAYSESQLEVMCSVRLTGIEYLKQSYEALVQRLRNASCAIIN